jgi:predicted dienelactone hydrolase
MVTSRSIMRRKRRGLWVAAVAAAILLACAPPASASARLSLPAPSGTNRVGVVALHLIDHSRPDPWRADAADRELMVSVYYPARRTAGYPAMPYMLPGAAAHFGAVTANQYLGLPTGQVDWSGVATHAAQGAPVCGRWPVLIYSPGLGEPRTWDTTLVEDLASRGYVVVTVDNTYESPEVQFPDGSVATWTPPGDPDAFLKKALAVRVRDTSFVLDQLAAVNSGADGGRLAGSLDLTAVGMFGHSAGGTAAAAAMDADPRIGAGIDMDGNLTWLDGSLMPVAARGLDRPFLFLGKDGATDTGLGWQAFRANTPGWTRRLTLRGSQHASFTDAEALLPQMNLPSAEQTEAIGTIDPTVAVRTQEAYVSAFFDRWLRGRDNRLLDGPSPRYPAMEFAS